MRSCKLLLALAMCPLFLNCSTSLDKTEVYRQRIDQLSLQLKTKSKQINELKEKQLVYSAREKANFNDPRVKLADRIVKENSSFTEKENYKNILSQYKAEDSQALEVAVLKHVEIFPQGMYTDNSLYWLASHYYKSKNYGRALKYYNQLVSEYKTSEKRGAGLLAKALTYQKLKLNTQAKSVIEQVYKEFPNSTYSRKAKTLSKEL